MIAAFLAPYALRGTAAPYLWVFYKLLSSIEEPMALLLSEEYLSAAEDPRFVGREELDPERMQAMGYTVPSQAVLSRHHIGCLDSTLMERLLVRHNGNPLSVFKAFLSEEIEELKAELRVRFDAMPAGLEAILTWCNCPSLSAVARERGLRVVHLEMGPLRQPAYRATAYLDFSGVNGNTEAHQRYADFDGFDTDGVQYEDMRQAFARKSWRVKQRGQNLGVVLQVEDDSNLLCFNNGFDNTALIARALLLGEEARLLVRSHPGSRFELRPGALSVDTSASSADFLALCEQVLTINSSVGLEALLHDVPVHVHGDASFRFIADEPDPARRANKLAFYLLAYLVPYELVFSLDYLRFRLSAPEEREIIQRHFLAYCPEHGAVGGFSGVQAALARMQETVVEEAQASEVATAASQPMPEGCRLYFRDADEDFSESASLYVLPVAAGQRRRARFLLPAGERPAFIRFDPGFNPASFELTAIHWGWGEAAGDHDLHILPDLELRVAAVGGLADRERGGIKSFSDRGESFFECSTGDLWASVSDDAVGAGIIEFHFIERSLELEAAHGHARLEAVIARLGSDEAAQLDRLLHLLEHVNHCSAQQIERIEELQKEVARLTTSMDQGDAAIESMEHDVATLIEFLRNKPTLWSRIMKRAT